MYCNRIDVYYVVTLNCTYTSVYEELIGLYEYLVYVLEVMCFRTSCKYNTYTCTYTHGVRSRKTFVGALLEATYNSEDVNL